jgi:diguanylate cyclase (GGDEF)-like protein
MAVRYFLFGEEGRMTIKHPAAAGTEAGAPLAYFTTSKQSGLLVHAGPVFWVMSCGITLILAIVVGVGLMIGSFRDRELQRAQQGLENTARLLVRHFDRQFADFEAIERSVASDLSLRVESPEQFRRLVVTEEFHRYLLGKVNHPDDVAGVNVFDADGNHLASSSRWPVSPLNLSDRSYFQRFKNDPDSPSVQVELVQSRMSEGQTIVVARKIAGPDGRFLGMVTRGIAPENIENFLSPVVLASGTICLLHQDRTLFARVPHAEEALGQSYTDFPLFVKSASNGGQASMAIVSPVDGEERLASVQDLEHYPLSVLATLKTSAVLADWREQARLIGLGAASAVVVALLMLVFIVRHLKLQHRRLDIAVGNMTQGLLLFDASERLVVCNRRYVEMFRLSPGIVKPGRNLREVIQHRKDVGSFVGDVDAYCEFVRGAAKTGERTQTLAETPDGRWMQVVNEPLNEGGWVSTIDDVTEQRRSEEKIARLALYDSLTELPNRASFLKHLRQELANCSDQRSTAVLFLDTDEFKAVNDSLGHHVGDQLLKSIAHRLQGCLGPEDFLARLGGDEFAIVVSGITGEDQLLPLIDRLYEAVRGPHTCGIHSLPSDTSIGIALAPRDGSACEEVLQNADLAMYDAKSAGRKTFRFFEPSMERKARERRLLELDLRSALENDQIDVHYQPILDLHSNLIVGCEALARWRHPERGFVSPADFIPVAEQSGLIEKLGEIVLRKACRQAAAWPDHIKMAVNVSPVQFKCRLLALKVVSALAESGLSPHRLEIEITEAVLIGDDDAALKTLHELRAAGVGVALDDFGTGYSSLSYLRKFPFDKIKIDRSFIEGLAQEGGSSGIVRAVVALASEHRMVTTAEGVETEQQRKMLQQLHCDQMQGFLLSRPKSAPEIATMLGIGEAAVLAS